MDALNPAALDFAAAARRDGVLDGQCSALAHPAPGSFDYWWQRRGHWVEPANRRRGGASGVVRLVPFEAGFAPLYCKRQSGHVYRSLRYPLGRPTIWREMQAYRALARLGIRTPRLIYGGIRKAQGQWQALLVTEALQGFVSLEDWYQTAPRVEQTHAQTRAVLKAVAEMLARLHRAGWRHGCCYAKHVFVSVVDNTAQAALLDLEKCRRCLPFSSSPAQDIDQLARHCGAMPVQDMHYLRTQYLQTRAHR